MLTIDNPTATVHAVVQQPRLLDRLRAALRVKRYALATERTYVHWVKRFIYFHGRGLWLNHTGFKQSGVNSGANRAG